MLVHARIPESVNIMGILWKGKQKAQSHCHIFFHESVAQMSDQTKEKKYQKEAHFRKTKVVDGDFFGKIQTGTLRKFNFEKRINNKINRKLSQFPLIKNPI